jgi:hypothetical protein
MATNSIVHPQGLSDDIRHHDYFNMVFLGFVCFLDIRYLYLATEWEKFGTDDLGKEYFDDYIVLLYAFSAYLLIDFIWVLVRPKCTMANSTSILLHHIVTALVMATPWKYKQFAWHLAISLSVEVNTVFLTLRRHCNQGTLFHMIFNIGFYASWVILRLILFPALIFFYFNEYSRYSIAVNSYWNILGISFTTHIIITILGFHWTIDLLLKLFRRNDKLEQKQQ